MYWLAIVPALPIWWSLCSGFSHAELVASELPHTVQARNPPPPKKARIDGNVFLFRGEMGERRKPSDIRQLGGFAPAEAGYQHHQSAFRMAHHMTGDLEEESDDVGSSDADTDSSSVDSSGERLWYTAFVSLSHHPDLAASYAEDDGFLYIIHSAPNMIDPRRDDVLRQLSSVNREVLALGGVQFSQVYGWLGWTEFHQLELQVRSRLPSSTSNNDANYQRELVNAILQNAQYNELYDMGWSSYGLTNEWTTDFGGIRDATAFMDSVGRIAGWEGSFPLRFALNSDRSPQPTTSTSDQPDGAQNSQPNMVA